MIAYCFYLLFTHRPNFVFGLVVAFLNSAAPTFIHFFCLIFWHSLHCLGEQPLQDVFFPQQ